MLQAALALFWGAVSLITHQRRANEEPRSEVTSPSLIKAVFARGREEELRKGSRCCYAFHRWCRGSITARESPVNIFPRKNENVNNFKMIQCHRGMEKGHAAGDHLSLCPFKELFSYYIF